jgi:hypothetical protein
MAASKSRSANQLKEAQMKRIGEFLLPWIPFVFAIYVCYSTLSLIAPTDLKSWEPAFYSFLPMSFFFVGAAIHYLWREVRSLRSTIAALQAKTGNVAV